MTASEKIKTINDKIKQDKAKYNLDRQTAKKSAYYKISAIVYHPYHCQTLSKGNKKKGKKS